jgi:hypothetical protein
VAVRPRDLARAEAGVGEEEVQEVEVGDVGEGAAGAKVEAVTLKRENGRLRTRIRRNEQIIIGRGGTTRRWREAADRHEYYHGTKDLQRPMCTLSTRSRCETGEKDCATDH